MKTLNQSTVSILPSHHRTSARIVESRILFLRQQRVILDVDIAEIYGVPVKVLNQQVKRNWQRFPEDFVFQLTTEEYECLRSQFVTSKAGRGGRRYTPYAFTEHGAIMLATVLNSKRAVEMSLLVVRAFVRLREMLSTNRRLAEKIYELESRVGNHDSVIRNLVQSIKGLMAPEKRRRKTIGFQLPSGVTKRRESKATQRTISAAG